MDSTHLSALSSHLLAMGDDELVLGHRNSEWCGHAPLLEEDIAFANIALDEIGHAALWYGLLSELQGSDPDAYPDRLVYFRSAAEYRNAQWVELPHGDWAFTMLRQYLFDAAELARLEPLSASAYERLAGAAAKVRKEEIYHHRHTRLWVQRLAHGTEESHRRMQDALDVLWPYTAQALAPLPGEDAVVSAGLFPAAPQVQAAWEAQVLPFLASCGLALPAASPVVAGRDQHTPHLALLLDDLQAVARLEPEAAW